MKYIGKILKYSAGIPLALIFLYVFIGLILSYIPVNEKNITGKHRVFLHTNGIHLDLVIPLNEMNDVLKKDLLIMPADRYISFGWGDKAFYLNTPEWKDLKPKTAFRAFLLPSESLLHLTRYQNRQKDWIPVQVSAGQLDKIQYWLNRSFDCDTQGNKQILSDFHFSQKDNFYLSGETYSAFKTCNTWVNAIFKKSGLRSSVWTTFDFGLLHFYE